MKSPTTILAERANVPAPEDGLKVWRDAAQAQIDQPVIDACLVSRPGSYSGNLAARQFGLLGKLAVRKRREMQAGGLPKHFILAVTAHDVIALGRTLGGRHGTTGTPGEEVARWKRSDLNVTWKPGGYSFEVLIESPGEAEAVQCQLGKSPLGESFLELLANPKSQAAATG